MRVPVHELFPIELYVGDDELARWVGVSLRRIQDACAREQDEDTKRTMHMLIEQRVNFLEWLRAQKTAETYIAFYPVYNESLSEDIDDFPYVEDDDDGLDLFEGAPWH